MTAEAEGNLLFRHRRIRLRAYAAVEEAAFRPASARLQIHHSGHRTRRGRRPRLPSRAPLGSAFCKGAFGKLWGGICSSGTAASPCGDGRPRPSRPSKARLRLRRPPKSTPPSLAWFLCRGRGGLQAGVCSLHICHFDRSEESVFFQIQIMWGRAPPPVQAEQSSAPP